MGLFDEALPDTTGYLLFQKSALPDEKGSYDAINAYPPQIIGENPDTLFRRNPDYRFGRIPETL